MKIFAAACIFLFLAHMPVYGAVLRIKNETDQAIISILAQSPKGQAFLRLDLLPGASDEVENPGGTASLRVDTGLQFRIFKKVNLAAARELVFHRGLPPALTCRTGDGVESRVTGLVQELAPQPGDRPVCNLDSFQPSMPMKDVCAILPKEMPRDDNGALLTGMGFGGMTWAARLVPSQAAPVTADSHLEHLELRRPLAKADLAKLVDMLFHKGYAPWQAEFPQLDMEFAKTADMSARKKMLIQAIDRFMNSPTRHKDHAAGEKCAEASVIMAPAQMLETLEKADEPPADVQIYTIILRPCINILLLDVAAYRGQES